MRVGSATAGPTGDGERSDGGVPCAKAFCHRCRYRAERRRRQATDVCTCARRRNAAEPSGSGGVATTHAHALLAAIAAAAGQRGTACTQQGSGEGGTSALLPGRGGVDERTKGWLGKYVWVLRELG